MENLILSLDIDFFTKNNKGATALGKAFKNKKTEIAVLLIKK